jgi:sugar transferase (PEP-CTERM/EpsH1 system associated)
MNETPSLHSVGQPVEKSPIDLRRRAQTRSELNSSEADRKKDGLNLLYLCHRVPCPPDKGDKIRAYHEILSLARHHRVHLLTLADGPVPDLSPLAAVCERVEVFPIHRPAAFLRAAAGALNPRPLTLSFFESAALRRRVQELAGSEKFDLVVAYSSSMAPYAELVEGVPAVLDMVDVDSAKWGQYSRFAAFPLNQIYALEARRLQAYEAGLARRFERIVLATGNETRLFKSFAADARAATIPNGVDLDFFQPFDLPKAENPTLVFTGQMDYFANVDGVTHFARVIHPRLRQRFPDLELLIVGRAPAPAVRALGELPGVMVTGAVGDVRPFLSRAWGFVAPLRIAQGVQNKVLEAMASALPVVCTDRVHAGLSDGGFQHDRDLLVAADDEAMESNLVALLEDAGLRDRLAECARQRLLSSYRWQANMDRFEELLIAAARRRSTAPGGALALPQPERPAALREAGKVRSA